MKLQDIKREPKLRKNLKIFTIMNSLILLAAVAYSVYFNLTLGTEHEIKCVFKEAFGLYCPGCGGSRSLTYLFKLDPVRSFIHYPPLYVAIGVILGYDIRLVLTLIKGDSSFTDRYKFYPFIFLASSIILHFVLRNALLLLGIDYIGDILHESSCFMP